MHLPWCPLSMSPGTQLLLTFPKISFLSPPLCTVGLHLHGGAEVASSSACPAQSTDGCGFDPQGLPPRFLGKCTRPQPLKGAGPPSLGSFITRRDLGEGAQEDCSATSGADDVWEPPHAKHFHTPLSAWLVLGRQAACAASLKCLGSGRVCIALWGEDPGHDLPSTAVFLLQCDCSPSSW